MDENSSEKAEVHLALVARRAKHFRYLQKAYRGA